MNAGIPSRDDLEPGMKVAVVEKHNQSSGKESVGVIERTLTNSETHPHGIKVKLTDGRVGRVKRILGRKSDNVQ